MWLKTATSTTSLLLLFIVLLKEFMLIMCSYSTFILAFLQSLILFKITRLAFYFSTACVILVVGILNFNCWILDVQMLMFSFHGWILLLGWRGWCLVLSVAGKVSVCPYVPELPSDYNWGPWSMQTLHHQGAPADNQASGRWWNNTGTSVHKLWHLVWNVTFVTSSSDG